MRQRREHTLPPKLLCTSAGLRCYIRIYSRRGADFTKRFPRLVAAASRLRATSVVIDGERIVYDQNGMPDFNLIPSKGYDREVSLIAFDILEKDGEDLRSLSLVDRKSRLHHLVSKGKDGIEFVEHLDGNGADIFRAACGLEHEGALSLNERTCLTMSAIKAAKLLASLVPSVEPPEGVVILMRRREPTDAVDSNWDAAASASPAPDVVPL